MTSDQFTALAELLRLRGGPATDAARLILVEGFGLTDAAHQVGISVQSAFNAVARCKRGLALTVQVQGADKCSQPTLSE